MARFEHLPIYRQAFVVAVHLEQVVAGFSRYHKYSLGTELRHASHAVVTSVARANSASDKAPHLLALREQLDELLLLIRLAKEAKAFRSFGAYQHAVELIASVCRQNEGWLRSVRSPQVSGIREGQNRTRRGRTAPPHPSAPI